MSETSQSLIRAIALAAFTAVFAGMWHNDRPRDPTLALRLPADQRSFVVQHVSTAPVFKLNASQRIVKPLKAVAHVATSVTRRAAPGAAVSAKPVSMPLSRTISIETEGLMISQAELSQHMHKLPLGIAAGDYRIDDSQGGVGWLHVVDGSQMSFASSAVELLTTEIGDSMVRFVPVQADRTAALKEIIAH